MKKILWIFWLALVIVTSGSIGLVAVPCLMAITLAGILIQHWIRKR